jgi:hypothetical protein
VAFVQELRHEERVEKGISLSHGIVPGKIFLSV